jgi:hypothetical protein
VSTVTLADNVVKPAIGPAESAVLSSESSRFRALTERDIPTLRRLLADELTYTHSSGLRQTKAQYVGDIETGSLIYKSISASGQHVQLLGSTAIVTGAATLQVTSNGTDRSIELLYTEINVKRRGRWQLLAWQSTSKPK